MSEKVDRITRPTTWGSGTETVRRNPAGRLRLFAVHCGETKFEDTAERPLEEQLNAILAWIHRSLASQRADRAIAAERLRLEEEAAQIRERERAAAAAVARQRDKELRRLQAEQAASAERERLLQVEAGAWRDAEAIRAYVAHLRVVGAVPAPGLMDWLTWADAVADKIDPTTKRLSGAEGS